MRWAWHAKQSSSFSIRMTECQRSLVELSSVMTRWEGTSARARLVGVRHERMGVRRSAPASTVANSAQPAAARIFQRRVTAHAGYGIGTPKSTPTASAGSGPLLLCSAGVEEFKTANPGVEL